MPIGLTASQGKELQVPLEHVEFTADQPMRPVPVDGHSTIQQPHLSALVGASHENDGGLGELTRRGERGWHAQWSRVNTRGMFVPVRAHKPGRAPAQGRQRGMAPAMPYFVLPQIVIAFDLGLEACFARRRKDGHDTQTQAQMDDASQAGGFLVRTLEARVVVELGKARLAKDAPMCGQALEHIAGGEGARRPGGRQAAAQRDAVEHLDRRAVLDGQTLDEVEGVQFGCACDQIGQIPSGRRSGMALARAADQAVTGDDTCNGASGRRGRDLVLLEMTADGVRTVFPQGRVLFEPDAQAENAFLQRRASGIGRLGITARGIIPVHAIQALAVGAMHPLESGAHTQTEAARGKVMVAARNGTPIPAGWALDADGEPTTDAKAALKGSMLPMGGNKGAMLALVVELLACALTGAAFGFEADTFFVGDGNRPRIGQAFLVVDPEALAGRESYLARVETLVAMMQDEPDVRMPGARRDALAVIAARDGIVIPQALADELALLASG